MVAVLAAVTMLSAGLAVPMQQAIASDGGRDGVSNNFEADIDQEQECGGLSVCTQTATITGNDQTIREMGPGMSTLFE